MNEVTKTILERRSIRAFTDKKIDDCDLNTILRCGMAGPSACDMRPLEYIVIRDKETINRIAESNGHSADPLKGADTAILVCGNLSLAFDRAPDYWIVDASIAMQNMILSAESLGISSLWLGTWPQENKISGLKKLFHLPDEIIPHSVLALGYKNDTEVPYKEKWDETKIHYGKW